MPTLAEFAGLKVCMYREDRSPHHFPHVHVYFAEYDAVIRVPDGELLSLTTLSQRTSCGLLRCGLTFMLPN